MSDNQWDGPEQKTLTPGEVVRRFRTLAAMRSQGKSSDDEGYHADLAIWYKLEEIADKEAQFKARLDALIDTPDVSETAEIKKALAALLKEKAELMGQVSTTERSPAQQRQVNLIEKVRELMQRELDTTWPDGQRGLKMHVIRNHYPELQRIYSHDATAETMAGKTKPSACKKLGVPQLPT